MRSEIEDGAKWLRIRLVNIPELLTVSSDLSIVFCIESI